MVSLSTNADGSNQQEPACNPTHPLLLDTATESMILSRVMSAINCHTEDRLFASDGLEWAGREYELEQSCLDAQYSRSIPQPN
jgi:hypothetical protein